MERNPLCYDEAFIFYSKDYKKVKILHYDLNGYVMYEKWFDDGRFLKSSFEECKSSHRISRETLILLLFTAVRINLLFKMRNIDDLSIEELERRNEALRREIIAKRLYAAKLEAELLVKCKDKKEMKRRLDRNKQELGLI